MNTPERKPVGALAVLRDMERKYEGGWPLFSFAPVISAVAELIEADKEYDRARSAWENGIFTEWEGISDTSRAKIADDFERAMERRHDALDRVGGAA